jgi:hypothetical protein
VGDGPCCSKKRVGDFTPTLKQEAMSEAAKLQHTQALYETTAQMGQYLSLHFGPMPDAFGAFGAEAGILRDALDFPKKCGEAVNRWGPRQRRAKGGGAGAGGPARGGWARLRRHLDAARRSGQPAPRPAAR